jgi:hypothetical protein
MANASSNRRRSRRGPLKSVVRVECRKGSLGLGLNLAVKALDLSETGIRVVARDLLPVGAEVEVLLSGGGAAKVTRRLGRVVWSVALEGGNASAGIAFDKPLQYSQVQSFLRLSN